MSKLIIPVGYESSLSLRETEKAIKYVKDSFQTSLSDELNLQRVSAPLFVESGTGVNDDLNGIETKARFYIPEADCNAEILFSLAKWKRMKLAEYGFKSGEGLYTDMNAIRADEGELDNIHSVYVDQWDWEKVIKEDKRTLGTLVEAVSGIYRAIKKTEYIINDLYSIDSFLPREITFIHTEDLLDKYPLLSPKQREDKAAKKYGAIFVLGIGGKLKDGSIHDGRAPDYDDWTTMMEDSKRGLNGDIVVWNPVLGSALELSSMGIRVNKEILLHQLKISGYEKRKELSWHKRLLNDEFPQSIGGGIGQSRLCMFLLHKAHIGEVQSSIWPKEVKEECQKYGINLL